MPTSDMRIARMVAAMQPLTRLHNEAGLTVLAQAVLDAPGIATVELPEPEPGRRSDVAGEWHGGEVRVYRDGDLEFDWHSIEPDTARSLAADLLAGAAAAEALRDEVAS